MKTTTYGLVAVGIIGASLLGGCTTPGVGGSDYTYSQVRGEQAVQIGTVESLRKVKIQGGQPGLMGTIGGAVAGAALGNRVGEGNGNIAATLLGTLAAGAAGQAIENKFDQTDGVQLTIRLDNGYVVAVTQGIDEEFRVGDRVQVLNGAGATRVTRLDPASALNYARPLGPPPSGAGAMGTAPALPPRNAPPPPPEATAPQPGQIQFYCPDSNAYFPAVSNCKSPWMKVVK